MSAEDFMVNRLITMGDKEVTQINFPKFADIVFQPLPGCIDYDATGYSLMYTSNYVDLGTGMTAEFLLRPRITFSGDIGLQAFTRAHINKYVDIAFATEGQYRSFWASTTLPVFEVCRFVPASPENLEYHEFLFGTDQDTGEPIKAFYAVNWGQVPFWEKSNRLLAIYTDGYSKCIWTKVTGVERTADPRVLKVTVAHALPKIAVEEIDVVAEFVYMRLASDDCESEYTTSEVAQASMSFTEDADGAKYDPWTEAPVNYPKVP